MRPAYDGPSSWLWLVGAGRIGVLLIVAAGTGRVAVSNPLNALLITLYAGAFVSSLWYLIVLRKNLSVSALLTWTQMLVDFGIVAVTISITKGQASYFTFLLVIVILEAGVLMGLVQGFIFASLATIFMGLQFAVAVPYSADPLAHWYDFLIQGIAFFFTAFISGYWNQRVSRMKHFQREILDNMNSGFLITDSKGLVIGVNKSACQILELVEGNVAGRHVDGIIRPESGVECPITTALRLQKDFASYEFYAQTQTGKVKLLGLTTNRIHDVRGHVTGLIASFTDLTEMARMRQELQQQDRMAAIGEQLAGLAHEIRNPVTSIRSAMDELRRNTASTAMVERLAAIGIRESDHLNEIVTGFLDFARDPSKRRELFSLQDLLAEVEEMLRQKYADAKTLEIRRPLMGDAPCQILGDRLQIRQVFLNIAQNAIEAMREEGALTMTLHPRQAGDGPGRRRGYLEVRFDDEGPGIAPDKVARIFEPFYTEKEHGVGMGLAICMRMVTAHDGTIQVASRPGGGTSMIVRLPAAPA
jgi:two-component system sensor histidine kinase PilS (NtrC family)